MQSKALPIVYNSQANCVISSPTGSGKTVLFELSILREFSNCLADPDFKALYLAPTKALCSEKLEDWNKKFAQLNITVGILTGDSTFKEAENVRKSNIIISTPEKWDMITRKWKDYSKLFGLIKLLLVDEIHILKDTRGSTLEVVVTRMKRICIGLRILAISATVANAEDISKWIKLDDESSLPAETLCFGEEFRAVQLFKIVYGYKPNSDNDFQFDMLLNSKLIEVINQHSKGKPVLIFCPTRNSCQGTAKFLFNNLNGSGGAQLKLKDHDDATYAAKGIAYHHAGLVYADRKQIENAFLNGGLKVLCSTSTLAVGINLPAYLVIIKGTKCWAESCFQEYAETDILQMVGRAGRPQFESEGVAVIMTTAKLKSKYERLVKGTEKVESSLHLNFTEHLAAEIAVGVIKNVDDALVWLKTTYLYVRFVLNPGYYALQIPKSSDPEETLTTFCRQQADALRREKMITMDESQSYKITPYGYSMTMHYISFGTMTNMVHAGAKLSTSEVLNLIVKSTEFSDLKLKHQEKRLYREINNSPILRYPSKLKELAHHDKVNLIIQFELGGLEFPTYNGAMKLHSSFLGDKFYVFKHIYRLMMALLEVFIEKKDAASLNSLNYLLRCINGKCWEGSPNELRQLEGVGPVSVKKFCNHNVLSLEDTKSLTNTQIEYYLGLKTGAGSKIKKNIQSLPQLSLSFVFDDEKLNANHDGVCISMTVTIDVLNATAAANWRNKLVYIHLITDTSSGELLDFRRIPICKFKNSGSKSYQVSGEITNLNMNVRCHASADCIASVQTRSSISVHSHLSEFTLMNFAQRIEEVDFTELDEDDNDVKKLFSIEPKTTESTLKIEVVDLNTELDKEVQENEVTAATQCEPQEHVISSQRERPPNDRKLLPNGNYECNHFCKDKLKCRHLCCREGLPPKAVKRRPTEPEHTEEPVAQPSKEVSTASAAKRVKTPEAVVEEVKKAKPLAKKSLKLKRKNVPFKRTLFDDSDPEEISSIDAIMQYGVHKKQRKLTERKIFSIDKPEQQGIGPGEREQEESINSEAANILDESIFDDTVWLDNLETPQQKAKPPVVNPLVMSDTDSLFQYECTDLDAPQIELANPPIDKRPIQKESPKQEYNKEILQEILGFDLDLDL
ncbi:ATP-dependent DNA helicase MER3 [Candida viswanathii]|uniref:DNA 3'-5' helicase n=1 Tax=Candida viswanathii TaxID=5486 RepID=A0A367XNG4_9ASCO|nr:ATP-dependent DNA helicase MER3 [Candida viswanathii]